MRLLDCAELRAVSGGDGESMCGEYGIDTGDSCIMIGGNEYMTGRSISLVNYFVSGDSFGMNLMIDGASASVTAEVQEDGSVNVVIRKGSQILGGMCVLPDAYIFN